jgi:hypothetical protein
VCATSGSTIVAIPIGDGYISGLKVAPAKAGGPFVGQLVFTVTPGGGGVPATYTCGSAGVVPVPVLPSVKKLAIHNLVTGCTNGPSSTGRRLLTAGAADPSGIVLDATKLRVAAGDAGQPAWTLAFNGVPVRGPLTFAQLAAVSAANCVAGCANPLNVPTATVYTGWPAQTFTSPANTVWPECNGPYALCSLGESGAEVGGGGRRL